MPDHLAPKAQALELSLWRPFPLENDLFKRIIEVIMQKIRVGIIGCGAMGGEIARACDGRLGGLYELVGLCDTDNEKARLVNGTLHKKAGIMQADALISAADLVVEAATAAVSAAVVEKCIEAGKDCLVMSVGGLLGRADLLERALRLGISVYMPSGALCGVDGLKSASAGRIDSVTLTTRKPVKGLEGAPYLMEKRIDLGRIDKETVVFEGTAEEAVKGFPANVNVSAVLSLAGVGAKKTKVRIVTAPDYTRNVHEVEITGDFGRMTTRSENLPSSANPRTSGLAIYSAIATLEGAAKSVRVGT
jgi:aspartate dehydrogenase